MTASTSAAPTWGPAGGVPVVRLGLKKIIYVRFIMKKLSFRVVFLSLLLLAFVLMVVFAFVPFGTIPFFLSLVFFITLLTIYNKKILPVVDIFLLWSYTP